jgi:hypothetical protein
MKQIQVNSEFFFFLAALEIEVFRIINSSIMEEFLKKNIPFFSPIFSSFYYGYYNRESCVPYKRPENLNNQSPFTLFNSLCFCTMNCGHQWQTLWFWKKKSCWWCSVSNLENSNFLKIGNIDTVRVMKFS